MVFNTTIQILLFEDTETENHHILSLKHGTKFNFIPKQIESQTAFAAILQSAQPHLILLDENLSTIGVVQALQLCREYRAGVPIIVLSEQPRVENAVKFLRAGACDYIDKEDTTRLEAAIDEAVRVSDPPEVSEDKALAQTLLAQMTDPIVILSLDRRVKYLNPAAVIFFEIEDPEAFIQQPDPLAAYFDQNYLSRVYKDLETILELGNPVIADYQVLLPAGEKRWIEAHGTRIFYNHAPADLITIRDTTPQKQALLELEKRDQLLEGVAHLTHLLLVESNLETCLQNVLQVLGAAAEVDRAYIFRNCAEPATGRLLLRQWLEWAKDGADPEGDAGQLMEIDYDTLPDEIVNYLSQDFVFSSSTEELERVTHQVLQKQNFISILIVPIYVDNTWWGFIGFDNCTEKRVWLESETSILKTAANTIGAAIHRQQIEKKQRENENRYRILFEDSPAVIWQEDFSAVKQRLDQLRAQGVQDFRAYFEEHPEVVTECLSLTRVIDSNKAAQKLHNIASKDQMPTNLKPLFSPETLSNFHNELLHIANGFTEFETEVINQTVDGKRVTLTMKWAAIPGYEHDLSNVITSMIDITERKQGEIALLKSHQSIQRQVNQLNILHEIGSAITLHTTPAQVMQKILEQLLTDIDLDAAAFISVNSEVPFSKLITQIGLPFDLVTSRYHIWEEACVNRVLSHSNTLFSLHENQTPPNDPFDSEIQKIFPSFAAIPVIVEERIQAILMVYSRQKNLFDTQWQGFLKSVAVQAAISIENAHIVSSLQTAQQDLQDAYEGTLQGWAQALELRDKETKGHSERVIRLSVQLANTLRYPPEKLADFRRGVLLHDIGKMAIPDSILFKPDSLTENERMIMRQHPVYAFQLLSKIPYLRTATDIPLYHHERWDGSGYPKGLRGEEIPLAARIFSVIDVWDAVTSDRPYHPAFPRQAAREIILRGRDTQFDPIVVDAFLAIIDQHQNDPDTALSHPNDQNIRYATMDAQKPKNVYN